MKTLKTLNKVSKIVVTKIKNKYCFFMQRLLFFFSSTAHETLTYFGPHMKCSTKHGTERNKFQTWWLKSLVSGNPLNLKEVSFAVAKC